MEHGSIIMPYYTYTLSGALLYEKECTSRRGIQSRSLSSLFPFLFSQHPPLRHEMMAIPPVIIAFLTFWRARVAHLMPSVFHTVEWTIWRIRISRDFLREYIQEDHTRQNEWDWKLSKKCMYMARVWILSSFFTPSQRKDGFVVRSIDWSRFVPALR